MPFLRSAAALVALVCVALISDARQVPTEKQKAEKKTKAVPVVVAWRGKVKVELRKEAPKTGYVADSKSWEKLWKAWRGKEEVPHVNFKEAIILVGVNTDLNRITIHPEIDDKGDLRVGGVRTFAFYFDPKECNYHIVLIMRRGIKTIEGKEIGKE
jgi:hypothetical protein